jgi:hypothetical protein
MHVFGGFFVACIGSEGAFPLPYANGHARKSMHVKRENEVMTFEVISHKVIVTSKTSMA